MDFVILDLNSQSKAVQSYVSGWQASTIFEWLQMRGKVEKVKLPFATDIYYFESYIGLKTGFRILDTGQLVIFLDNSTFLP